jgi:hypothetical protein
MDAPLALQMTLSALAIGVAWRRVRGLLALRRYDAAALAGWVKRRADGQVGVRGLARTLVAREPESIWGELAAALEHEQMPTRTALCNEPLGRLEAQLAGLGPPSGATLKMAILSLLFCVSLVVIAERGLGAAVLDTLGLGGGALVLVWSLGREADRLDKEIRVAIDRWVIESQKAWGEAVGSLKVDRRRRGVLG